MNRNVKCAKNQGKSNKFAFKMKICVIMVWNNFVGIKFHFYHLATILWGNFFVFSFNNKKVFYKFCYCIDYKVIYRL